MYPTRGARIGRRTGVLTIDAETPSGSAFRVSADVGRGQRTVSIDVHVFTPEDNPLVGMWREEAQLACGTGEEVSPEKRIIEELRFRADSTFSVTWMPFETYKDYWGTYTYDLAQGSLDLVITARNFTPDDVDGSGLVSFDDGEELILRDMWLGRPRDGTGSAHCGHRFIRIRRLCSRRNSLPLRRWRLREPSMPAGNLVREWNLEEGPQVAPAL